jgi:protocatechuate 3,4-dioxygenase beta subunit
MCALLLLVPALLWGQLFGGQKKQDESSAPRILTGTVFDHEDKVVANAIVYLKNTRSRAVATYIAGEDGGYRFNNLSPNVDYEVRAELSGHKSPTKTLSSFDTRKQAHINLKMEK